MFWGYVGLALLMMLSGFLVRMLVEVAEGSMWVLTIAVLVAALGFGAIMQVADNMNIIGHLIS
jgi:hypothetical protein